MFCYSVNKNVTLLLKLALWAGTELVSSENYFAVTVICELFRGY